jgi:hypothetical protein
MDYDLYDFLGIGQPAWRGWKPRHTPKAPPEAHRKPLAKPKQKKAKLFVPWVRPGFGKGLRTPKMPLPPKMVEEGRPLDELKAIIGLE